MALIILFYIYKVNKNININDLLSVLAIYLSSLTYILRIKETKIKSEREIKPQIEITIKNYVDSIAHIAEEYSFKKLRIRLENFGQHARKIQLKTGNIEKKSEISHYINFIESNKNKDIDVFVDSPDFIELYFENSEGKKYINKYKIHIHDTEPTRTLEADTYYHTVNIVED